MSFMFLHKSDITLVPHSHNSSTDDKNSYDMPKSKPKKNSKGNGLGYDKAYRENTH